MSITLAKTPWRIEARSTPFHPWRTIEHSKTIEAACARSQLLKKRDRYYAVRVRAN